VSVPVDGDPSGRSARARCRAQSALRRERLLIDVYDTARRRAPLPRRSAHVSTPPGRRSRRSSRSPAPPSAAWPSIRPAAPSGP
jgi:hypothetical protein